MTRFPTKIKIHTAYQRPAYLFSAAPFCMRPTSVQNHPACSMEIWSKTFAIRKFEQQRIRAPLHAATNLMHASVHG